MGRSRITLPSINALLGSDRQGKTNYGKRL